MDPDREHGIISADVEERLCSDPDVEFAVLFGSRVSGTPHPSSDLDVAVEFTDDLSRAERLRKRCQLSGQLQGDDAPFVDLSDIQELPLEVARDAVDGELVCGDEEAFQAFADEIEAEFERRQPELERRRRATIRRIATDGLHG